MQPLKILVFTGNSYSRYGIASMLQATAPHTVLYADGPIQHLFAAVAKCKPDVLIADMCGRKKEWSLMPEFAPSRRVLAIVESVPEFLKINPYWPVDAVVQSNGEPAEVLRWVGNCVRGPLCEGGPLQMLLKDGHRPMNEHESQISITPRERQIIELVSQGCCNKRIAQALFISVTTVRTHRYKMMAKLGLHNAVEIARYAERFCNPLTT